MAANQSTTDRVVIAQNVVSLLRQALIANAENFPRLAPKIRATLKSAEGAVRHAERMARQEVRDGK
jgi:hypothetical protein